MNTHWKTACAAALLAIAGSAAAAQRAAHGAGDHPAPPPSSNRQALPDADRGLDRAQERESGQGLDNSRAREQPLEHAPAYGMDHRHAHSLQPRGQNGKHAPR